MRDFLLGKAEVSGGDTVLCVLEHPLQAVKWRQSVALLPDLEKNDTGKDGDR